MTHDAIPRFIQRRDAIRHEALSGHGGVSLAGELSRAHDELLVALFDEAWRVNPAPGAALVAVGGYGRATLAHGSDLDLVLLVDEPEAPAVGALAEALLHPLWDAGIALGHAVRSADDFVGLARSDLRTATTVLDARCVAGDGVRARAALDRCAQAAFEGDLTRFLDGLNEEMTARHRRFGATVYLLEPDVKQSRGGMRDLDVARWALRARFRARSFTEALGRGALTEHERDDLDAAQEFIWRTRMALHARSGRRTDRLSFDEQEEVAPRVLAPADASAGDAAERLMSAWWSHARDVSTLSEHIVARCHPARHPHEPAARAERVADDVALVDGALRFARADAHRRDPPIALRIIELAVARRLPLAPSTRDAIAAAARDEAWCASLRSSDAAAGAFRRLMTGSTRARLRSDGVTPMSETETNEGSVAAELHDLGLLLAMIPEFAHVTARVQRDIYHVYTVDVHSVAALDRLHSFARGDAGDDFPLPTQLIADTERLDLVCLATLLHDIGKSRGAPHALVGAEMARPIARRLGFAPDDASTVAWLVAEHLSLYHAATRRDLGDPSTLAALVETVGDPWRLRALYLLTAADLSTTSPTAMTSWKARMLDELYLRVDDALASGEVALHERAAALRAQSIAYAPSSDQPAVARLLARLPERYTLATAPEAILRHARALDGAPAGARSVHVAPLDDLSGELFEVLVTAPDRPGLLSLFAAMLHASRLDVQGAHAWSSNGDAIDVFVVRSSRSGAAELARVARRLPGMLDDLLDGRDPDALVRASREGAGVRRPEPGVRAEVRVHDAASEAATVIEVFGRDRPGFLYEVASAVHRLGLRVVLAKVNTEGNRAADSFYVIDAEGAKLSPERSVEAQRVLLAVVEGAT